MGLPVAYTPGRSATLDHHRKADPQPGQPGLLG
jgi:hypothetical protein